MKASTFFLLPIAAATAAIIPMVDDAPTATEKYVKTPGRIGRVWHAIPTPSTLDKRQRDHRNDRNNRNNRNSPQSQSQQQQTQQQQQTVDDIYMNHPGAHGEGAVYRRDSVVVHGNGTSTNETKVTPTEAAPKETHVAPRSKGPPKRPERPKGERIPDEKVTEVFSQLSKIVKQITKDATGFGNEGSGMRPDKQRNDHFKAIEKGFREWIKIMQNIEDRMLATREWHIPAQMTVAHIYFDYTKDVENMLKVLGTHTKQFDFGSEMRCEVATLIAHAFMEYRYLADDLYTKKKKDRKHTGGRLLRNKFYKPLPATWEITGNDPARRESIPDWVHYNDKPNEQYNGNFVAAMREWKTPFFKFSNCKELEHPKDAA